MNDYYTYAYLREDLSPYYVGKGRGNRAFCNRKRIAKPKDRSRIIYLREGMSEKDALNHEIEMIKTWGRKDLGTGMLRNMTDGGECGNKTIRTDETKAKMRIAKAYTSPETRLKMSLAHMGQKLSPERRKNLLLVNTGRKCTQETKAKIRLASIGKKMSHESRLKMSLANLGKKATNQAKANMSLAQFARWKKYPEGKC